MEILNLAAHAAYQKELAELLAGMEARLDWDNIGAAIKFRRKWGLPINEDDDPALYLVGLHRQRFRSRLVPPELRGYSGKWLVERGFSLETDKVFAVEKPKGGKP